MDFLVAIAPQLAALLRAAADYLDGATGEELDDLLEDQPAAPVWQMNDRGGFDRVVDT